MPAPYELNVGLTDDETPEFSIEWKNGDGTDFPWSSYAVAYGFHRDGARVWSCLFTPEAAGLTQGAGIAVNALQNLITFTLPGMLQPGRYQHGCKMTHLASGKVIQVFDGSLTVTEGNVP